MVYTEVKKRNGNKYYYRALSIRKGYRVEKKRAYMGRDLTKKQLNKIIKKVDDEMKGELINENINKIKSKIMNLLVRKNIKKAGVFGSYAHGEQKKESDVDIIIDFKGSLLEMVRLEMLLKKALRKKIDLITYNGISPLLKKRILNEEIRII